MVKIPGVCSLELEELDRAIFVSHIENRTTSYLGYDPKFSHVQDEHGESNMVDLVRHLGENVG